MVAYISKLFSKLSVSADLYDLVKAFKEKAGIPESFNYNKFSDC